MNKLFTATVLLLLANFALAQTATKNKVGGVCFRVDDHQTASKWRDWNALFNKHQLKFSLAINASRLYNDTAARNALIEIAASGHELMDHTPDHHMGFFNARNVAEANTYANNPAVDHINGVKVCVKVAEPRLDFFTGESAVNLIGNRLISVENGGFAGINGNPFFPLVYLPSLGKYAVYTSVQNRDLSNPDTLVLQTYWQETWPLDTLYNIAYHRIRTEDVRSNVSSNVLLAERSKQLFAEFGLPVPKTWIQPGGSYALLNRLDAEAFSASVAYNAAAVNILSAQKCYNEVDTNNNKRFGLQGPDFYEESQSLQVLKNTISDRSARHFNSFGLSHMHNVAGGWSVFLNKVDSLLLWCKEHQIPVRTYNEWGSILFDSVPNPMVNILPPLHKDLNGNALPDGYNSVQGFLTNDGVAAAHTSSVGSANNNANIASIQNLGGVEKGENLVSVYTKGQVGDSIRMLVSFPEYSRPSVMLMFAANTPDYTKQERTIVIPADVSRINVSWIVIKRNIPGMVRLSYMEMRSNIVPIIEDTVGENNPDTNTVENDDIAHASEAILNRVGGICFRVDDNQSAQNYRALAQVFNSHQKHFTVGVNSSKLLTDSAMVNALKELVLSGHEVADHTPDHALHFFNVNLVQDTLNYVGHPGVDRFIGRKVCLKIDSVQTETFVGEGLVNVAGNLLISVNNGEWINLQSPTFYGNIYLPHVQRVFTYSHLQNKNSLDPDTLVLGGYWGESVQLTPANNVAHHRVTQYQIKPNAAGIHLLMERSKAIFSQFQLPAPKTFLSPSGNYAMLTADELKTFAHAHGYTAGGLFQDVSLKCYLEYNPSGSKQFAMHGPDFRIDNASAAQAIAALSNNSARHYNSFELNGFTGLLGGTNGYLARLDSVLTWGKNNGLPILTFNDWAKVLYQTQAGPFINVMPALHKDLDKNNAPDGYSFIGSTFDTMDGVAISGNRSFSRSTHGALASVTNLGGLDKGNNTLWLSSKGMPGDSVRVVYSFPELGSTSYQLMFAANTPAFEAYSAALHIPAEVSRIHISWNAVKRNISGPIKISGMQLFGSGQQNKAGIIELPIQTEQSYWAEPILFPNPFSDYIDVRGLQNFATLTVYSYTGATLITENIISQSEMRMATETLPSGIYFVKLTNQDGSTKQFKMLKK